jgi:hypothetical protein
MKINVENSFACCKHMETLYGLSGNNGNRVEIYKKLRKLELKATRLSVMCCNGKITTDEMSIKVIPIEKEVKKLLPDIKGFFIDDDCLGYALKIESEIKRKFYPDLRNDLGGHGILAPEF